MSPTEQQLLASILTAELYQDDATQRSESARIDANAPIRPAQAPSWPFIADPKPRIRIRVLPCGGYETAATTAPRSALHTLMYGNH